jgi:hypothetical protein
MHNHINNFMSARFKIATLVSLLFLALFVRLWGIDFGLPYIYHTDEWFEIKRALKLGTGVFDFERVSKGGYFILLFIEYGFIYIYLKMMNLVSSASDFLILTFENPTYIWLPSRITTAVIGTFNCLLVYLLLRKKWGFGAAILATLFLAINNIHNESSHYVTVDVPLTTLITLCFYMLHRIEMNPKPSTRLYIFLGLSFAFALATKITAAPFIFTLVIFQMLQGKQLGVIKRIVNSQTLAFCATFICVYIAINPGIIFKFISVVEYALSFVLPAEQATVWKPEFPLGEGQVSKTNFYFSSIFGGLKSFALVITLIGTYAALKSEDNAIKSALIFLVVYTLLILSSKSEEHIYERYLLPIIPIIAILWGIGVTKFVSYLSRPQLKALLALTLTAVSLYPYASQVSDFSQEIVKPDTRTEAKLWIEENIDQDSWIVLEGGLYRPSPAWAPPLFISNDALKGVDDLRYLFSKEKSSENKASFYENIMKAYASKKQFNIIFNGNRLQLKEAMDADKIDYIILSNSFVKLNALAKNRNNFPVWYELNALATSKKYEKIKTFFPEDRFTGPELFIFKKN